MNPFQDKNRALENRASENRASENRSSENRPSENIYERAVQINSANEAIRNIRRGASDQENSKVIPLKRQSDLLSRRDAADFLGVTEQTLAVWKCTQRYNLPFVKIGRLVKYKRSDLEAFIENNRREPASNQ